MSELDLASALALKVANSDALVVRIANVDVWGAPGQFGSWSDRWLDEWGNRAL